MMRHYILFALALCIATFFIFMMGTVLAHHYVFLGEVWKPKSNAPKNYINADWALPESLDDTASYFVYDPDSPIAARTPTNATFGKLVGDGVSEWATQVPQLKWDITKKSTEADVQFIMGECDELAGSFYVSGWHHDKKRTAKYIQSFSICINEQGRFENEDAINATISHEIGHFYSLAEAYIDLSKDLTPTRSSTVCSHRSMQFVCNVNNGRSGEESHELWRSE